MQKAGLRKCIAKLAAVGALTRYRRVRANGSEGSAFTVLNVPRTEPLDFNQYEFVIGELIEGAATQGSIRGDIPLLTELGGGIPEGTPIRPTNNKPKRTLSSKAKTREAQEAELSAGTLSVTYDRRKVPFAVVRLAATLLDVFNSESGKRRQRFKPNGDLTPDFRLVIGAVLDHPEVDEARWIRTLQTLFANPWWNRTVSIYAVFSPKIIDENLDDPARGKFNKKGDAAKPHRDPNIDTLAEDLERLKSLDTG
jgi:hypothetical protein